MKGHENIERVISTNSENYITDLISEIKEISSYFKKINRADQSFYKTSNPEYKEVYCRVENKLQNLIKSLLSILPEDFSKLEIKNFTSILRYVDDLLERVSENIDVITGKKKDEKAELEKHIKEMKQDALEKMPTVVKVISEDDMFDIDNSYYPFIPKISIKYNAKIPLDERIPHAKKLREENKEKFILNFSDSKRKEIQEPQFSNPYRFEINECTKEIIQNLNDTAEYIQANKKKLKGDDPFIFKYISTEERDQIEEPIETVECGTIKNLPITMYIQKFKKFDEIPLTFIDTPEVLDEMIKKLSEATEIAVDLEHHSYESYLGITCLIQISTRKEDFIVDALALRSKLNELNKVFTDPKIVKVFHGADYDITWLQKDFGVYVVNMFDTGRASRVLCKSSYALKSLLKELCDFDTDKKYQLEDWRKRPLPKEMLLYARGDTHFLLYIYDVLKEQLITKSLEKGEDPFNLYIQVLKHSSELCEQSYQKEQVKNGQYYHLISMNSSRPHRELGQLKEIYIFRDYLARKADVSTGKILTKKQMFDLSKLRKYTYDTIMMTLSSSSLLIKYIPEFIKVMNSKIERMEKKKKAEKEKVAEYEKEYCEKIKKMISRDEENEKMKKKISFGNQKINIDKHKEEFDKLLNEVKVPKVVEGSSKIYKEKEDMKVDEKVENIKKSFNQFNIVNHLKVKHNIAQITLKTGGQKKEKKELNKKQKKRKEEEKDADDIITEKLEGNKKFIDVTDNKELYKNLKEEKSESEDELIVENENKGKINESLSKKEAFYKKFLQNSKNNKDYDNTKYYSSKRKKK